MSRFICLISCFLLASIAMADHHKEKQYIELRYYHLKSEDAAAAMDEYFASALIPALNRAGVEAVGVFKEEDPSDEPLRLVVIPHDQISDVAQLNGRLAKDRTYQDAGSNYLALKKNDTPLVRIRSELLDSFDCWPRLRSPAIFENSGRIFELRIYESSSEHFGNLKVEMFNAGEVPIFLDSGIQPVFMGQAILGDKMPNLTYLTVYKDQAAKDRGWDNFRKHPDWKVLSAVQKYKGTVSKIHKINLVPLKSSQL